MKIGIEHRQRILAGILITFAALLVIFESRWFEWAAAVPSSSERLRSAAAEQGTTMPGPWLDPTLSHQELERTENRFYQGNARNIFRSDYPIHRSRIRNPLVTDSSKLATPLSSLNAERLLPQATLRFFGFALMLNQPAKAFLVEGDSVFVAHEGEIVNRRYRVLRIDSNSCVVEDLIEKSVHELELHS